MDLRTTRVLHRLLFVGLVALPTLLPGMPASAATVAAGDTLVMVNGDPITTVELDRLVMAAHKNFKAGKQASVTAEGLLRKRVDDYLLIQDAMAAGYDQDEALQTKLAENTAKYAIGVYVRENVSLPKAADPDSVRAYFDRYYWRLQMRRVSVRTAAEAEALRAQVAAGADMDTLARAQSLDTKKLRGGLSNLMYWADVENRVRDAVRGLKPGELSPVFAYNDAFAFIRVEQIVPVDETDFARFENSIIPIVHGQARQRVWDAFLEKEMKKSGLTVNVPALMEVVSDSATVLKGEFLREQPALVFELPDGEGVSGTKLRRAISHEAMQKATEPFGHHLAKARADLSHELVLGSLARAAGYDKNPEVDAMVQKDWEEDLIARYLADHVTAKITFKREELTQIYEQNKERMRGPDEVRLDVMIMDDADEAAAAAASLQEGADFGYVFKQYNPGQDQAPGSGSYIAVSELSRPFREALEGMKVGDSSNVIKMPMGNMVFHLDGRRPGAVPPFAEVETEIRRTLFKRNFDKLLKEHLDILRKGSQITWYPEVLDKYLAVGEVDGK